MGYILRIEAGPGAGREVPLDRPRLTIGRQADNDLALPDGQLSRHHARLDLASDGVTVTDLGSANGTRVDGQPLTGPRTLRGGELIQLGDSALRLVATGDPWAAAPAPPPLMPVPPAVPPARGQSRLPLILGGTLAALLVACVCLAGAVAVARRGGNPTPTPAPQVANADPFTPTPLAQAASGDLPTAAPPPIPQGGLPPTPTTPTGQAASAATRQPTLAPVPQGGLPPTPTPPRAPVAAPTATAPRAAVPSAAPRTSAAPAAQPAGGTYRGTVQRGYEIAFTLSADGKTISGVQARVLTKCNNKSYSEDLVFLPPVSFPVAADGSFGGEGSYVAGGPRYHFFGQVRGDTASGTLQEDSAGGGIICDTYKLTWEATRQRP